MSGTGEMQPAVGIQDIAMEDGDSIIAGAAIDLTTPTASEAQDAGTFNITHRGPVDGPFANPTPTPGPNMGLSPNRPTIVSPRSRICPMPACLATFSTVTSIPTRRCSLPCPERRTS